MGLALTMVLAVAPVALADPPGNNGTVKIDGLAFDDHPNNEPHVGCVFQVDFYGYDEGDLNADVTFAAQPPTGTAVLATDVVFIGEDPAGGGTDLDASVSYDLSAALAGFEPHPKHGYHVKLTVNAGGSIGADTKHKVFWVTGCEQPPGTIIIEKYARPPGDTVFSFTGDLGDFDIVDTEGGTGNPGSQVHFEVAPGTYSVTEIVPYGWDLIYIACRVRGESTFTMDGPTVTISLESGDLVYCDFQNFKHYYYD